MEQYQVHMQLLVFHHTSLHNTPVHRFYYLFHDLPPTN
jgi:hypothetical protein